MKSCSTTKPAFLVFIIYLLINLDVATLYSASKYADGSSNKYT